MAPTGTQGETRISDSIGAHQAHHPDRTKYNRSSSDAISYEDLLVAQYLEGLKKAEAAGSRRRLNRPSKPASPYMQKFARSDQAAVTTTSAMQALPRTRGGGSSRPYSAAPAGRSSARERKRIDVKFVMDGGEEAEEGEEPRDLRREGGRTKSKLRPMSAPVYKTKRPWSGKSASSTATVSQRSRRNKALYRLQPQVIRATVYKNGTQTDAVRVTAHSMKTFLEACTIKLSLQFAARRIFLPDGTEVKYPEEIPKDSEVFISCGEPYRDPTSNVKDDAHKKLYANWTMNGVVLPAETKKKPKSTLSKRMRKMLESKMRRVMIFRNGDGTEMFETTASAENFGRFLDDCTSRLGLTVPARIIYSWTGSEVTDLNDVPLLDRCLQTSTTPLYGPVWISKGERFSPKGVKAFLETTIRHCKQKLQAANSYKKQLQYGLAGETQQVNVIEILSKTEQELEKELQETEEGIDEFTEAKRKLQDILDEISESVVEEEGAGSTYTMKHIKEFDSSHRLVGQQGIRLKVYENGQGDGEETVFFNLKEASKGVGNDHNLLLQRLLDVLTRWARVEKNTTALSTVVTKIFDREGKEITDVYSLKTDQEVWISFGEPFRDPNVYCLQLTFDKVQGLDLYGERNVAVREPLNSDDIPKGEERPSHWEATISFPLIYDYEEVTYDLPKEVQDQKRLAVEKRELDITGHFLQHKDDPSKVLYCELALQPKKKQGSRDVWPPRSQTWVINKRGQIYCRSMPQLALAVIEKWRVDKQFADGETPAQGLAVGLEKRQQGNPYQQWVFSEDGFIYATAEPDLVLTYIEAKAQDDDVVAMEMMMAFGQQQPPDQQAHSSSSDPYGEDPDFESNGEENADGGEKKDESKTEKDAYPGQVYAMAVIPRLPARHPWAKAQRWAMKQERLDNLGQWKHTKAQNPLWNKLAYSWPVNSRGEWNEDCDWPMEGYFIPYAPPIKKMTRKPSASEAEATYGSEQKESPVRTVPLRLRVLKNGERDTHRQAFVVGPDLTNMMRDLNRTALNGKRPHRRSQSREKSLEQLEQEMAQKKQAKKDELKALEFQLFLDRCTALLNLPFAARRLFDQDGREHDTLDHLQRDQLAFVSCGEAWNDPNLSGQEQQRRTILATLAADVNAMKQYCALRNPMNMVIEVEGPLAAGSPLVVNPIAVSPEERQHILRGPTPEAELEEEGETDGNMYANLSSHERAHIASDQRAEGLKWPWERVLNVSLDQVMEVNQGSTSDEAAFSNADLYRKFKPKQPKSPRSTRLSHQRFVFADGFLAVQTAPYLVVGLEQPELELSRVVLCKKSTEDASQRWEADTQGFVRSKLNPDLVLGAQMPSTASDDDAAAPSSSFCGQPVTLQHQRTVRYGTANQKWSFEKETGFVDAFAADIKDKEITAANKASVCTFAVCGETPLQQTGFAVTGVKSADPVIVCAACARSMRANHRLRKLEDATEFVCAVGLAPKRNVKMMGCFQCLNGKVDLSTFEASNTVTQYDKELKRLRQMSSARIIAREISAYQTVQMVKILAHRNGDGRSTEGVVMNGSTVRGLLDQCTYNLQLSTAARRLYTQDGTLILTVSDLIQWNLACYGMAGMDINEQEDEKDKTADKRQDSSSELKVSSVLRIPVEVWVSCGEQFVRPEHVDYKRKLLLQQREERAGVVLELEKEKHVLRQMQGRRTNGMEGPQYISTLSPDAPVMVEGGWTQPSMGEVKRSLVVHQLENHLQEVKGQQKQQAGNHVATRPVIDGSKKLYSQPNLKRVKVYKNGEPPDKHTFAWGSSMSEILQDGTARLDMRKAAAQIYTADGQRVTDFGEIKRDQLLCLSHGDHFKGSKGSRNQVEVKANWSRARKKDGPQATDIMVTSNKHPAVRVDPFGPPSLALTASPTED
ncbi:doublecortin domain-containing protein 1-like isoform X2 [Patiria miniata]|uniref:Doublecortin domain-containing protein n=1 Tax=Patiria miniata TaxID=46514 RepID=A0A913ZTH7_PATMI|nr:doublecortin domain-containing protein 1-like isoform X2 [Patiria miniata]